MRGDTVGALDRTGSHAFFLLWAWLSPEIPPGIHWRSLASRQGWPTVQTAVP